MRSGNIILISLCILIMGCVEKYFPDVKKSETNLLVVDGMLTNGPGPFYVRLSESTRSTMIQKYTPVSNYEVFIHDQSGNSYELKEIEPGTYQSLKNDLVGEVGKSYKLSLHSPSGNHYESKYHTIQEPSVITDLYYKLEYRENLERIYETAGYQFYLDGIVHKNDSSYVLWRLEETYKYESDYLLKYIYEGYLRRCHHYDSLYTCYKTETRPEIYTLNTTHTESNEFKGMQLHYVDNYTRRLMLRYSLLVHQLTVDKQTHDYWEDLKNLIEQQDFLYAIVPYQLDGNIYNINNYDEKVLGYFIVGGAAEKRVFANKPGWPVRMRYTTCNLGFGAIWRMERLHYSHANEWPLWVTEIFYHENMVKALPANKACIDCREKGGVLDVPDFWMED